MSILFLPATTQDCQFVWTGGWTSNPGKEKNAFVWLYTEDADGNAQSVEYDGWGYSEPDNVGGHQHTIQLFKNKDYNFADRNIEYTGDHCYICECWSKKDETSVAAALPATICHPLKVKRYLWKGQMCYTLSHPDHYLFSNNWPFIYIRNIPIT